MLLKIFTKINKQGKLLDPTGKNKYYESDEIILSPIQKDNNIVTFELFVKGVDDYVPVKGEIDLDKYGYELTNANGVMMERFITKTNLE